MPRLTLTFRLLIHALVGIVTFFVTGIIFDLAQIFLALLLIFYNINSVIADYRGIKKLASLAFFFQTRVFFRRPSQSLT